MKVPKQIHELHINPDATLEEKGKAFDEIYKLAIEQGYNPDTHPLVLSAAEKFKAAQDDSQDSTLTWEEEIARNEAIIRRLEQEERRARRHPPPVKTRSTLGHIADVGNSMRKKVTVDISTGLVLTDADIKARE